MLAFLAALKILPWRVIAIVTAGLLLVGFVGTKVHDYGAREFKDGESSVQRRWDAAEKLRADVSLEAQRVARVAADRRQAEVDSASAASLRERTALAASLAAARTDGDRLRRLIASVTGTDRDPAVAPAGTGLRVDGRAPAFGELLDSCSRMAEDGAGEAERLATQVRGLQQYIQTVRH